MPILAPLRFLPFVFEDLDVHSHFQYTFYHNTFTRSFGPFVPGDRVDMIDLELDSGILKHHGTDILSPKSFNIVLTEEKL